jgi:hypothetical protein
MICEEGYSGTKSLEEKKQKIVLTEKQFQKIQDAISLLGDYLQWDDADYPEGIKEGYWEIHKKAENVIIKIQK